MKGLLSGTIILACTSFVAATTGIIVPLYVPPKLVFGDDCAAWAPEIAAANSHHSVPFIFVINPNSGPGNAPGQQPSDTNYEQCVPELRNSTGNNVQVIGYIRTGYGDPTARPVAAVEQDIDAYAGWDARWRPTGIFFDEVTDSAATVSLYANYSSYARNKGLNTIVFNPGAKPDPAYYASADVIVSAERAFSDFSDSLLEIDSANPGSKQAVIVYATPSSSPTSTINDLARRGLGWVYFTDDVLDNPYDKTPTYFSQEVADVDATS